MGLGIGGGGFDGGWTRCYVLSRRRCVIRSSLAGVVVVVAARILISALRQVVVRSLGEVSGKAHLLMSWLGQL